MFQRERAELYASVGIAIVIASAIASSATEVAMTTWRISS